MTSSDPAGTLLERLNVAKAQGRYGDEKTHDLAIKSQLVVPARHTEAASQSTYLFVRALASQIQDPRLPLLSGSRQIWLVVGMNIP
jgi:hypothetical protein